jgi:cytochrome c7-like protein
MNFILSVIHATPRVDMKNKSMSKLILLVTIVTFLLVSVSISNSQESPHSAMEANPKDEENCLVCHSKVPKEGENNPNYLLNSEPSQVCLTCHSDTQHVGSKKHLDYMNPKESNLPGGENNKIACFTCHDPHPQGIIKDRVVYEADLGMREKDLIKELALSGKQAKLHLTKETKVLLRRPLEDNKLCQTCHVKLN